MGVAILALVVSVVLIFVVPPVGIITTPRADQPLAVFTALKALVTSGTESSIGNRSADEPPT